MASRSMAGVFELWSRAARHDHTFARALAPIIAAISSTARAVTVDAFTGNYGARGFET